MDDSLEELGIPKMYKTMHMWSKGIVIGWLTCCLVANFYESFNWLEMIEIVSWALYIPHIFNYSFQINIFVDLLFISILWFVQYY